MRKTFKIETPANIKRWRQIYLKEHKSEIDKLKDVLHSYINIQRTSNTDAAREVAAREADTVNNRILELRIKKLEKLCE